MADLEPIFVTKFLMTQHFLNFFGHTEGFIATMEDIKTPLLNNFLSGLKEDENGIIVYEKK